MSMLMLRRKLVMKTKQSKGYIIFWQWSIEWDRLRLMQNGNESDSYYIFVYWPRLAWIRFLKRNRNILFLLCNWYCFLWFRFPERITELISRDFSVSLQKWLSFCRDSLVSREKRVEEFLPNEADFVFFEAIYFSMYFNISNKTTVGAHLLFHEFLKLRKFPFFMRISEFYFAS